MCQRADGVFALGAGPVLPISRVGDPEPAVPTDDDVPPSKCRCPMGVRLAPTATRMSGASHPVRTVTVLSCSWRPGASSESRTGISESNEASASAPPGSRDSGNRRSHADSGDNPYQRQIRAAALAQNVISPSVSPIGARRSTRPGSARCAQPHTVADNASAPVGRRSGGSHSVTVSNK